MTTFTAEQRAFQETARRFAREQLAPQYQAREATGQIDRALVRQMGDLGLIGVDLPEEYGGLGQPSLTAGLIIEAIAYGDFNVAYVQLLGSLQGQILARHAAPELARDWIARIVSGEAIVSVALTEPRGGSDAGNLALAARRDGDRYILNGEKSSISMADQADASIVFARTGKAGGRAARRVGVPRADEQRRASRPRASTTSAARRSAAARCSSTTWRCRPRIGCRARARASRR